MSVNLIPLEQEKKLSSLVGKERKEELANILIFGEKYKKEGEEMKKNFWKKHKRDEYLVLLGKSKESEKMFYESLSKEEKEILEGLVSPAREKFFNEYLSNRIIYSGKIESKKFPRRYADEVAAIIGSIYKGKSWNDIENALSEIKIEPGSYIFLIEYGIGAKGTKAVSKVRLTEGVSLELGENNIGDSGAEAISRMELKEGVELRLGMNQIGDAGAEAISRMKLKEGVHLCLRANEICDEGAEALSRIELKDGVYLDLAYNKIGDKGIEALSKMKLKDGVCLDLSGNNVGEMGLESLMQLKLKDNVVIDISGIYMSMDMENKLKQREKLNRDNGINFHLKLSIF